MPALLRPRGPPCYAPRGMASATRWEPVIGLEVHAQLLSRSKLFCGCSAAYGAAPNTNVCPVCLGLPGALPAPNGGAVELAIRAGLALGCTVQLESRFARKNYFYPDMAKGYQISQYELPLDTDGAIEIDVDGVTRRVGIERVHLEEDAAKNLHGSGGGRTTVVDFNRAGVPLVEIVSRPDMRSAAETEAYLRKIREILMFAGVNDGNLEEGSFRCDANVSLRPVGDERLGTRTELKNINSFRFVRMAIESEIVRQEAVLAGGGAVVQETRGWNEASGTTVAMRTKEEAHDYRYFPDPDLPPLVVSEARVSAVREALPELPDARRARWQRELGLTAYDAQVLSSHPRVADYFDAAATALVSAWGEGAKPDAGKKAANFVQSEILGDVSIDGLEARFPVPAEGVAELLGLVRDGTINSKMAKDVLARMRASGRSARAVVDEGGLAQVTDAAEIERVVREVVEASPKQVDQYRAGQTKVLGYFVGQVMKATKGTANPQIVNELLRKVLS